MKKRKILILGITGMLGHISFIHLNKNYKLDVYGVCSKKNKKLIIKEKPLYFLIDKIFFSDDLFESCSKIFKKINPDYVINCIGIVKQSSNINDINNTYLINSIFPNFLSASSKIFNFKLFNVSTDCVFNGKKGNYTEKDSPNAEDLYGISKIKGEINNCKNTITLRTSIIGPEIKLSKGLFGWFKYEEGLIQGYKNAYFSGLTTLELSSIFEKLIFIDKKISGLFHISSKKISKFDLLNLINQIYNLNKQITPNTTFELDRSLNSNKFKKLTKIKINNWSNMLINQKKFIENTF